MSTDALSMCSWVGTFIKILYCLIFGGGSGLPPPPALRAPTLTEKVKPPDGPPALLRAPEGSPHSPVGLPPPPKLPPPAPKRPEPPVVPPPKLVSERLTSNGACAEFWARDGLSNVLVAAVNALSTAAASKAPFDQYAILPSDTV